MEKLLSQLYDLYMVFTCDYGKLYDPNVYNIVFELWPRVHHIDQMRLCYFYLTQQFFCGDGRLLPFSLDQVNAVW